MRWRECVEKDMKRKGVEKEDAADREKWKCLTRTADPRTVWENS